jgi:predicted transcriptional regulator
MKRRQLKAVPLAFRVSPTVKAARDRIGRADHRSTSSLIALALALFIEREAAERRVGH